MKYFTSEHTFTLFLLLSLSFILFFFSYNLKEIYFSEEWKKETFFYRHCKYEEDAPENVAQSHHGIARDCCVFCSWHSRPFCYIFHACKLLSSSFQSFTLFTWLTALGRLYFEVPLELNFLSSWLLSREKKIHNTWWKKVLSVSHLSRKSQLLLYYYFRQNIYRVITNINTFIFNALFISV